MIERCFVPEEPGFRHHGVIHQCVPNLATGGSSLKDRGEVIFYGFRGNSLDQELKIIRADAISVEPEIGSEKVTEL